MASPEAKNLLLPLGRAALVVVLGLLSIAATRLLLDRGRAAYAFDYSGAPDRLAIAGRQDPGVAEYARAQGDFWLKQSIPPRLDLAAAEYRKAVELNPFESFNWRDWAVVCWRRGETREAEQAFNVAASLDPNNYVIHKDFGDFLLDQKQIQTAALHHASAIRLNPSLARGIYSVYWGLGMSPVETAQQLLSADTLQLRAYFIDCLAWVDPGQAKELWAGLGRQNGALDADMSRAYFDFLIQKRNFADAKDLWRAIAADFYKADWDENSSLLWNGGFDHPMTFDGGLEWRIAKDTPPGTRAVVSSFMGAERSNCLWLHFEGKENSAFSHVRHFFFVDPGQKYRWGYRVNTLDITTENGPYVQLTVHSDPPLQQKGKVATGTGGQESEMEFVAPPDGHWAEIAVCRDQSQKLNNKVSGDAWYDGFFVTVATESTSDTLTQ